MTTALCWVIIGPISPCPHDALTRACHRTYLRCIPQFYWQQLPASGYQCIVHARTARDDYFNYTAAYGGEGSYLTCAVKDPDIGFGPQCLSIAGEYDVVFPNQLGQAC